MAQKKILTIVGARPQFIKAAAVSRALASYPNIIEKIVHTGQHFDQNMSDVFFEEMEIPRPSFNLEVHSLGHGAMTGRMLEGIEKLIQDEDPGLVLIYGDTNSTLAGALASAKLGVSVAHVEAGLRSFNMSMPEEINRILADRISNLLFCPTNQAVKNLVREGYENLSNEVIRTGDVMYDTSLFYAKKAESKSDILKRINVQNYVLVTLHRAENTDDKEKLQDICMALNEINEVTPVLLPMHPRTKKKLEQYDIQLEFQSIEPVGYLDMIQLIQNAKLIMTDSGGLQKEAYFFKKKCITMREETEWVELIDNGVNVLTGSDKTKILNEFRTHLESKDEFIVGLYGDGKASEHIAKEIDNYFKRV